MVLSVMVLCLMLLMRNGVLKAPPGEYIFNYLAQLMLAFTILWVYTFFAQYLIIWYANLPDETGRLFQLQSGPFSRLFWTFFVLKFVIPFSVLIVPYSRYTPRVIAAVAVSIIVGYWIERFTWIAGAGPGSPAPMFSVFALGASAAVFTTAFFLVRGVMKRYQVIA
jgi:Ni/Fe-hydrogenase subunit HybB-like protein